MMRTAPCPLPASTWRIQAHGYGEPVDTLQSPHRLFFALWPEPSTRKAVHAVASRLEQEGRPGGRATAASRYHITLQFLGDYSPLPRALVDAACDAAAGVDAPAFDLVLDTVGRFGGSRVWWLGCSRTPDGLARLWTRLSVALAEREVPVRSHPTFTPHLTIRRNARHRPRDQPVEPITWRVDRFVLIDSRAGAEYREIGAWPLRG